MLKIHSSDRLGPQHLSVSAQVCFWVRVVCKPYSQQLWHRCQAFWNKDRNRTLKIALHSSAHAQWPSAPSCWRQVRMWASSQPRGNEQCLLGDAQNSLSQWDAPASQAGGSFHFFVNLGGNRVGTVNGEERKCHVGLGVGQGFRTGCAWGGCSGFAIYAVSSLNSNFPYRLVCWLVTTNARLLFRRLLG